MNLEFRLLDLGLREGSFNTVLDRAIMDSVSEGKSPPTLLFTEWKPTVSLGNSQSYEDVNESVCNEKGIEIVRRSSGGQAVHLDDGYVVFSFISPASKIPGYIKEYRRFPISFAENVLNSKGIPARFHPPDNLVLQKGNEFKTLGNSGQIISGNTVALHSSLRHSPANVSDLSSTLRMNGISLEPYMSEISDYLGSIAEHNSDLDKEEIKQGIVREFGNYYGTNFIPGELNDYELERIEQKLGEQRSYDFLAGEPHFKSKGVCYFFLNGENIVPSLNRIMNGNKPSTYEDSRLREVMQNA